MGNRERHDLNWTTNNKQFHKLYILELEQSTSKCWFCGPHSGCNSSRGGWGTQRGWKEYRKYQCKDRN